MWQWSDHFLNASRTVFLISSDANLVQNFSLKKIQDIMQEFQDTTEISGHSGQILKFQEFQDNAQAWAHMHTHAGSTLHNPVTLTSDPSDLKVNACWGPAIE